VVICSHFSAVPATVVFVRASKTLSKMSHKKKPAPEFPPEVCVRTSKWAEELLRAIEKQSSVPTLPVSAAGSTGQRNTI
jgi:hypothetical protein